MINELLAAAVINQPVATVGMGATLLGYSDRHAATIISTKDRFVTVQLDTARRTDTNGMSECQEYAYTANPNGMVYIFRQDKSGRWINVCHNRETNRWIKARSGYGLRIGERCHYHDYSF